MQIKSNYTQERQWYLLEKWFSNPTKDFTMFLMVHDYPNNIFESDGLYFAQICKKRHFANLETRPLDWIREKMDESKMYTESDVEVNRFEHEAFHKQENRLVKSNLDLSMRKVQAQYLVIGYLYVLLMISSGLHLFSVKYKESPWWLI